MKFRGPLFLALISAFALSQTPTQSATPPKAGATCSKAGITSNYGGKKFTCVKNGKKLIWDKGTTIIQKVPTPTSSPTSSPTPMPSPSSNSPIEPGGSCSKEGDLQPLNSGQVICQNGKWSPYNSTPGSSSPGSTNSGSAVSTEWVYLASLTSGNGLGNVSDPSLVQEPSGKIRMYFKNGNDSEAKITGFDNYIHSAVSSDNGVTWTVESGVRMAVTSPVEVLPKVGGGYQAWGWKHSPSGDSMYYAESSDGLTFNEITISGLDPKTCKNSSGQSLAPLGDPSIVKLSDGTWLLHAQGTGVGDTGPNFARWACVATSPDGKTWTAVQSRSYGGSTDVTTNPAIYLNSAGKVEWLWPTYDSLISRTGDGTTFGTSTSSIAASDPERLDLANGTELLAYGNFDNRSGGVIVIAKRQKTSYSIQKEQGTPGVVPGSVITWSISGATQSQVTVWNFCLNKKYADIAGASVTYETVSGMLKVTARDPSNTHGCVYVLVGSEKVIG